MEPSQRSNHSLRSDSIDGEREGGERLLRRGTIVSALLAGWLLGRASFRGLTAGDIAAVASVSHPAPIATSAEEIAGFAREAQLAQLNALDSLDGKCANLIAFSGI